MPLVSCLRSVLKRPSYMPLPRTMPSAVTEMMPLRFSTIWTRGLASAAPFHCSSSSTLIGKYGIATKVRTASPAAMLACSIFCVRGDGNMPLSARAHARLATVSAAAIPTMPRWSAKTKPGEDRARCRTENVGQIEQRRPHAGAIVGGDAELGEMRQKRTPETGEQIDQHKRHADD